MKTIHLDERKQTGRILREMRQQLHESPAWLAGMAGLTRVQLGELEKGEWGAWNKETWEEAKERYFQALVRVEKRNTTPPPSPSERRSGRLGSRTAAAWLTLSAGLAIASPRPISLPKPKRLGPTNGER